MSQRLLHRWCWRHAAISRSQALPSGPNADSIGIAHSFCCCRALECEWAVGGPVGLPEPLQGWAGRLPGSGQHQQGPAQPCRHLQARGARQAGAGRGGAGRGGAGRGGAGLGQDCVASITASGRLLILDTRTACVLCGPGCLPSRSGAFHPEVEDEILAALRATFSPEGYPTPAMRAAGMLCGCSYGWTDPCRSEFKQASGSCLPGINT